MKTRKESLLSALNDRAKIYIDMIDELEGSLARQNQRKIWSLQDQIAGHSAAVVIIKKMIRDIDF